MTTTNDWIKRSDREVTATDCPVWYAQQLGGAVDVRMSFNAEYIHGYDSITHWRPAKADIPAPPKEPTQRERDEAAFAGWDKSGDGYSWHTQSGGNRRSTWHAALAWERAEIAKLLGGLVPAMWMGAPSYFVPDVTIDKLRARLCL